MKFIILVLGVLIGLVLSKIIFRVKTVGILRVDTSDPDDGPYLFLELTDSVYDSVINKKQVAFDVLVKDFISQK